MRMRHMLYHRGMFHKCAGIGMSGALQPMFSLMDLICFVPHDDSSNGFLGFMNKKANILAIHQK